MLETARGRGYRQGMLKKCVASTVILAAAIAGASPRDELPLALRHANPDLLSGGLFAALDEQGLFGVAPRPARAAADPDASKGRPLAILDARVGANVRLGDDPGLPFGQRGQAEPHLIRSAGNPRLLLATFQEGRFSVDGGAMANGYALSLDGGLSWTRALTPRLTTISGGSYNRATDPVAAIGPQGELYLQSLASIDQRFGQAAVVVSRSLDQGATWSIPFRVFESTNPQVSPDKNWLAVNEHPASATAGRLVSTWTNFTSTPTGAATGNHLVSAFSDDRGATWSTPVNITAPGSSNQGSLPVFLPDGSLLVVYATFTVATGPSQFAIHCQRSLDGGRSYPGVATTIVAAVNQWDDPDLRDGVFLPSAAVARDTGDVFVTYTALIAGSPRVLVVKSTTRGATWSAPVVVSDQPSGVSVMNPAIAVSANGTAVSVQFMDKRNAPDGRNFIDHYLAQSFDGGATWQANIRLTEMSSDIRFGTPTSRGVMLGDYLGLVAPAGEEPGVAIWCDTRTGDADPFTVRFSATPAATFDTWRNAHFARTEQEDGARTGGAGDFDGDGASNFLEFAIGTNPRRPESGTAFSVRSLPGSIEVSHRLRRIAGLSVSWEFSEDAANWRPISFSGQLDDIPPIGEAPARLAGGTFSISAAGPRFLRPTFALAGGATGIGEVLAFQTNSRLINLSTRGQVRTGGGEMIVGFVTDGPKTILLRATGPALASLGVAGALADPTLTLRGSASEPPVTNDNWETVSGRVELFSRLGAFPLAAGSRDAVISASLAPQNYTAVVAGVNGTTGIALVEAYDADGTPGALTAGRLLNLATRGEVGSGGDALIAGFVVSGTEPRRLLIRAIGPSLAPFGISGVITDPQLTLYRHDSVIAANDDWQRGRNFVATAEAVQRAGAFPLPEGSLDAAIVITLHPGAYTVVVSGVGSATGIGLVEIYDNP